MTLELDYDANVRLIEKIDAELELLGVEEIPQSELMEKLGITFSPDAIVLSTDTTSWTSRRVVVTYQGQQYELQIIEGTPISGESPLRANTVVTDFEAAGFAAGTMNALAVAVKTKVGDALSDVPLVGPIYTIADILVEGYKGCFDESTIIEHATGSATVILTTHMKYVFVKGYGSSDSWQILAYMGNSVKYVVSSTIVNDIVVDKELKSFPVTAVTPETTEKAPYYDDYSFATSNYVRYRSTGNSNFEYFYALWTLEVEVLEKTRPLRVPYEEAFIKY